MSDNNNDTKEFDILDNSSINTELNQDNNQKNKAKKSKETDAIKVLDQPKVQLPKVLQECVDNGFKVFLTKEGYYVSGFYGINSHLGTLTGYIFAQDTNEEDTMVFYDHKLHKHFIKTFTDLVILHSLVWSYFYKNNENYKKPDLNWFPYLLEHNALNISPAIK